MSDSAGDTQRLLIADPLLPEGIETLRAAPGIAVEDLSEGTARGSCVRCRAHRR